MQTPSTLHPQKPFPFLLHNSAPERKKKTKQVVQRPDGAPSTQIFDAAAQSRSASAIPRVHGQDCHGGAHEIKLHSELGMSCDFSCMAQAATKLPLSKDLQVSDSELPVELSAPCVYLALRVCAPGGHGEGSKSPKHCFQVALCTSPHGSISVLPALPGAKSVYTASASSRENPKSSHLPAIPLQAPMPSELFVHTKTRLSELGVSTSLRVDIGKVESSPFLNVHGPTQKDFVRHCLASSQSKPLEQLLLHTVLLGTSRPRPVMSPPSNQVSPLLST
jgi:hypothetical protein